MGFERRILSFLVRCHDHTTGDAVENCGVIFEQYKTGELFILRRLKKQIGENIVNVPCALNKSAVWYDLNISKSL
jgi:hypothetical protein